MVLVVLDLQKKASLIVGLRSARKALDQTCLSIEACHLVHTAAEAIALLEKRRVA